MFRMVLIGGLLITLTLFGCQQSEQTQPAQAPPPQPPAPQVQQQSAAEEAETEAAETAAEVEERKEGSFESAGKTIDEVIENAGEKTTETYAAAKETTQDVAASVNDQAASVVDAGKASVDQVVTAVTPTASPEEVIFKGSFGTVTMPHQVHAAAFSCALCHGEGTPGAFDLGRDAAHALCIDCHKEQKVGPTGCTGCHIR